MKIKDLLEFSSLKSDGGDEFNPNLAAAAERAGLTKGGSLHDGATLAAAHKIDYWDVNFSGLYKAYYEKGFKAGRLDKINWSNKQYNMKLKLQKDGSIK